MADVQVLTAASGYKETLNSTAWHTLCTIPAGSFTAGDKYLILATAHTMLSGTADEVKVRLVHGTTPTQFTDAYEADEVLGNKVVGVGFMAVYTQPGTTEAITLEYASSTTGQEAIVRDSKVVAINLDDIGTQSTDYWYSEDTTDRSHSTTPGDDVSVTFTPNGTDKYLYIANVAWNWVADPTTSSGGFDLVYDGTTQVAVYEEGEDLTNEQRNRLLVWANTPTNASHTVKVQGYSESGTIVQHLSSRMLVLNLAKFADAHIATPSDHLLTAIDTWETGATTSFTPSASQDYFVLVQGSEDYGSNQNPDVQYSLQINPDGNGLYDYPGTLAARDTFTEASGTPLLSSHTADSGHSWSEVWTMSGVHLYVDSATDRADLNDGGVSDNYGYTMSVLSPQVGDGYIEWQTVTNAEGIGGVVRYKGTGNDDYYCTEGTTLYRVTNGSATSLGTVGSGPWYRLYASGSSPTNIVVISASTQAGLRTTFTDAGGWVPSLVTSDSTAENQTTTGKVGLRGLYDAYGSYYLGAEADNVRVVENPFLNNAPDGGAWDASDVSPYTFMDTVPFVSGASRTLNLDHRYHNVVGSDTKPSILDPVFVVFSKALAGSGSQNLTLGLIDPVSAIYALSAIPEQSVSLGLLDPASTVYAPTILPQPVTVTLGLLDPVSAVYAPSLVVVVHLGLIDPVSAVYAPTLTPKNSVALGLLDPVSTVYAPTVVQPPQDISLDLLTTDEIGNGGLIPLLLAQGQIAPQIFAPTLTFGAKTVGLGLLDPTSTIYAPTLTTTSTFGLPLIDPISAVYAPTVTPTNSIILTLLDPVAGIYDLTVIPDQPISLTLLDPVSDIYAPSVSFTISLGLIDPVSTTYQPTLTPKNTISLGLLDPGSAVFAPTILPQPVTIDLTLLDPVSAIYAPTLTTGAVTVTVGLLDPISDIYAPSVGFTVALGVLDPISDIYAPSVTFTVSLGTLDPVSVIYAPTITTTVSTTLDLLNPISAIYDLTVIPVSTAVSLGLLDPISDIYAPSVHMSVALGLIDAASVVYTPTLTTLNTVTLPLVDQSGAVYAPTVLPQPVTVDLVLINPVSDIYALTVTTGAVTVDLGLLDPASDIYAPSVGFTIHLGLVDPVSTTYDLTVTTLTSVTLGLLDPVSVQYDLSLTPVNAIDLGTLDPVSTVYAPTVLPQPVTVSLGLLDPISDIYALTVASGIGLPIIDTTSEIYDLSVLADQAVSLTLLDPSSAVYDLTVAPIQIIDLGLLTTDITTNGGLVPLLLASPQIEPRVFAFEVTQSAGTQGITLDLLDPTSGVYAPSLGFTVSLDLLDPVSTVYAPTLTTESTISLGLLDSGSSVYAPTILPQPVTVDLTILNPVSSIYDLTLAVGPVSVDLGLLDPTSAIYAPSISVWVDLPQIDPISGIYAPSVGFTVDLGLLDPSSTVYDITVTSGVGAYLDLLNPNAAIYAFTVLPGPVSVDLGLLDPSSSIFDISVGFTVSLGTIDPVSTIYAPSLSTLNTIDLGLIDQSGFVYALTVLPQGNYIDLELLDPVSAIYDLTVAAGAATVALPPLDPVSAIYAPTVTSLSSVDLGILDPASSIFELSLLAGAVPVGLPLIDQSGSIYSLTVLAEELQVVELGLLDPQSDIYPIRVRFPVGVVSNLPNVWYPYPFVPDEVSVPVSADLTIEYRIEARIASSIDVGYRVANQITKSFPIEFRVREVTGRSSVFWWKQRSLVTRSLTIEYDNFGAKLDRFWDQNREFLLNELDRELERYEARKPKIDQRFWDDNIDFLMDEIDPDIRIAGGQRAAVERRDVHRGLPRRPGSRGKAPDDGLTLVRTNGSGRSDE